MKKVSIDSVKTALVLGDTANGFEFTIENQDGSTFVTAENDVISLLVGKGSKEHYYEIPVVHNNIGHLKFIPDAEFYDYFRPGKYIAEIKVAYTDENLVSYLPHDTFLEIAIK